MSTAVSGGMQCHAGDIGFIISSSKSRNITNNAKVSVEKLENVLLFTII